jgi:cephalosporin hydroxylase
MSISESEQNNFKSKSLEWMQLSASAKYSYNFTWLGIPIIQYPQDIVALQEIIYRVQPELIIETGIAHGGSLILSASLLKLLDLIDIDRRNNPNQKSKVLGIDIEIRKINRDRILSHPLADYIEIIEGSSTDPKIAQQVESIASKYNRVMVFLDSNHSHDHVLQELRYYGRLVTSESYCVVFVTVIEEMPKGFFVDRPWDVGNSPMTAVIEFLQENSSFSLDDSIEDKLQITTARHGYLKKE